MTHLQSADDTFPFLLDRHSSGKSFGLRANLRKEYDDMFYSIEGQPWKNCKDYCPPISYLGMPFSLCSKAILYLVIIKFEDKFSLQEKMAILVFWV